jgi:hypothetical protein
MTLQPNSDIPAEVTTPTQLGSTSANAAERNLLKFQVKPG